MNNNNHNPRKPQCTMLLLAMILSAVSVVCSLVSLTMRNIEQSSTTQPAEDCSHLHDCPIVYYIEGSVKESTENPVENSVETVESSEDTVKQAPPSVNDVTEPRGVLTPSNLTASELEDGLLYELKDYSEAFITAERVTGVNAVFLSSIAALESGWGRSNVALSHNNLFGWTSESGYMTFDDYEDCIMYVACKLKELYLDPSGIYFSGYEVSDVNIHYNGSDLWENEVTYIMEDIHIRIAKSEV